MCVYMCLFVSFLLPLVLDVKFEFDGKTRTGSHCFYKQKNSVFGALVHCRAKSWLRELCVEKSETSIEKRVCERDPRHGEQFNQHLSGTVSVNDSLED